MIQSLEELGVSGSLSKAGMGGGQRLEEWRLCDCLLSLVCTGSDGEFIWRNKDMVFLTGLQAVHSISFILSFVFVFFLGQSLM